MKYDKLNPTQIEEMISNALSGRAPFGFIETDVCRVEWANGNHTGSIVVKTACGELHRVDFEWRDYITEEEVLNFVKPTHPESFDIDREVDLVTMLSLCKSKAVYTD